MITLKDLLGQHSEKDCTPEQLKNLINLRDLVNFMLFDYGKTITITSGLRDMADMKRIYKSDNFPKKSKHLFGLACDIYDPKLELNAWLKENNSERMKRFKLWGELGTSNWTHLQSVPMASYNPKTDLRWFNP